MTRPAGTRSDRHEPPAAPPGRRRPARRLNGAGAAGQGHRRAGRPCLLRAPVAEVDRAAVLLRLPRPRPRRPLGHRRQGPTPLRPDRHRRRRPGGRPCRLGTRTRPPRARRGRLRHRRRHATQRARHHPPQPAHPGGQPGRRGRAERRGATPEPSDAPRVWRQRHPGHHPHPPRRDPGGIGDLAVVGDAGALLPTLDSLLTAREGLATRCCQGARHRARPPPRRAQGPERARRDPGRRRAVHGRRGSAPGAPLHGGLRPRLGGAPQGRTPV
jgi:hypothetical protein